MSTRLAAARVLRPDGSLDPGVVIVEGGRIIAVEDPDSSSLPDRTLAPGFVDLQVNGFGRLDVAAGDAVELGHTLAAAGTTAWCPTLTSRPLSWYGDWFADNPHAAPGEVGVHLEGPFLSRAGAHDPGALRAPDLDWLEALPVRVAIVTLAPELPRAVDAIRLMSRRGVLVSLGHSEATFDDALAAAEAGAGMVTHAFNAMAPLRHRDPGLVGAALTDDRLVPAVIGDGAHVHPAVLKLVLTGRPAVLVSDSVAWERGGLLVDRGAGGAGAGAAVGAAAAGVADVARRADGTLAGSVITLADAVRRVVDAGVPLGTALLAASTTPAGLLGLAARGVLAPGARADIVALDADLQVASVWVEGELLGRG